MMAQPNQNELDSMSHSPTSDTSNTNKKPKSNSSISHHGNSIKKHKLKEFQFKFTKRENIDKKIMRKFRKYLKEKYKKHNQPEIMLLFNSDKFWIDFATKNLLPPFVYDYEEKEFKSFNTSYMLWVFKHVNSLELYAYFINTNQQKIIEHFKTLYHLEETDEEFISLKMYILTLAKVFCNYNGRELNLNDNWNEIIENSNHNTLLNKNSEEIVIEDYADNFFCSHSHDNEVNYEQSCKQQNTMQCCLREQHKGHSCLNLQIPEIFNEIIQSNEDDKRNEIFHSKSYGYASKELNETITDESIEYGDNKEDIMLDNDYRNENSNLYQ